MKQKNWHTCRLNWIKSVRKRLEGPSSGPEGNGLNRGRNAPQYFVNLEKRNYEISSLSKLKIDDTVCEDGKLISQYVVSFYEKLCPADPLNKDKMALSLQTIQPDIRKIDEDFQSICGLIKLIPKPKKR